MPGMGRALYETQPIFRQAIDRCGEILRSQLDRPLLSLLDPQAGSVLDQTGYTQPVMFAFEYALAQLWQSWGIVPSAVMGHSVGEFAAVCVAGVLSLEDGLTLIAQRAAAHAVAAARRIDGRRLRLPAAGEPPAGILRGSDRRRRFERAGEYGHFWGRGGGPRGAVRFLEDGIKAKILATSHAFHSHRMDPILDALRGPPNRPPPLRRRSRSLPT